MSGSDVGFAEEYKHEGFGMAAANLGNFCGGMAVARPDFAQVFAGHAIEAIERDGMFARGTEEFVKRSPIVSPIKVEADALAKFRLVDLTTPPFVHDVLIAREDGFEADENRTFG